MREGDPGTYCILLRLNRSRTLAIGRLGRHRFPKGFYGYVGSALGGLTVRLRHHLRVPLRPHWHVDYLRPFASVCGVWSVCAAERLERRWTRALRQLPEAMIPVAGFGASDCCCPTHLMYFRRRPYLADVLAKVSPADVAWIRLT